MDFFRLSMNALHAIVLVLCAITGLDLVEMRQEKSWSGLGPFLTDGIRFDV